LLVLSLLLAPLDIGGIFIEQSSKQFLSDTDIHSYVCQISNGVKPPSRVPVVRLEVEEGVWLEYEFEVVDDIVYDFMIFDKSNDFHFCTAVGTEEGVYFIDFADHLPCQECERSLWQ